MANLKAWRHRIWGFNIFNRRQWVAEQAARIPAGKRVLDVGAGSGQYRPLFSHCEYRSQDFGKEPGTIGNYAPLDYESDILEIPVQDESFDVILCTEVLEHVPEPIRALQEMSRILRPGGCMLLTAPLASFLHQEPFHFYGGYTPHWYRKFCDEAGCDIESLEPNQGFFSLMGQEMQRFNMLVHPRQTRQRGWAQRGALTAMWLATWPVARCLPWIGSWLDGLQLEQTATIGYHVVARKRSGKIETRSKVA